MKNSTRDLLAWTDAQLKFCPPDVWPAWNLTFVQHCGIFAAIHDHGFSFPVAILFANIEGEPWSQRVIFSLS